MRSLVVVALFLSASLINYGQFPFAGISVQEVEIPADLVGNIDATLTGPATARCWRVYACIEDPNWEIQAVFGDQANNWVTATTTTFYQAPLNSGEIATNVNEAFFLLEPESRFDSWFTIGEGPDGMSEYESNTTTLPGIPDPFPVFESGSSFVVNDAIGTSLFALWLPPSIEGRPNADGRVLLAQITTDGVFSLTLNLQLRRLNPDGTVYLPVETVQITGIQVDGTPGAMPAECGCSGQEEGCIFPDACNYSSTANCNDGSCVFPGCTDSNACNYDENSGCDDGSCILGGCTDFQACNYSSTAGCDDGSCSYPGCTEPSSFNYDPTSMCDDESCLIPIISSISWFSTCSGGESITITGENFTHDAIVLIGGVQATNVIFNGTTDLICLVPVPETFGMVRIVVATPNGLSSPDNPIYFENGVHGCTNSNACNFNPDASCDDGSCSLVAGCMEEQACNYNPNAVCDNGNCDYVTCSGCTYSTAIDYDSGASIDDGSCNFDLISTCPADFNGDSEINTTDLLVFLSVFDGPCE